MSHIVILLGPPGAGKGSQATLLKEQLRLPHVSTGDLLRDNIKRGTELGKKMQVFMDAGKLGPDELILDMLFERVSQKDCREGYILDGFPRTLHQAEAFMARLSKGQKVSAINLAVSNGEILKRIIGRVICKNCQTPYHKSFSPPQKEGQCDKCPGELYQREDDSRDVVLKRLDIYEEQTAPLINYFEKLQKLHHVNCEKSKSEILKEIKSLLQ